MIMTSIYVAGVLITFSILVALIKTRNTSYALCLQCALMWFMVPVIAVILTAAVIRLAMEDDEGWEGI